MTQQDKDYLDLVATGIRAELKALSDMFDLRMCDVSNHQKESNGKLNVCDEKTKLAQWIQCHTVISVIFFIIAVSVVTSVTNIIGLKKIIELLIK